MSTLSPNRSFSLFVLVALLVGGCAKHVIKAEISRQTKPLEHIRQFCAELKSGEVLSHDALQKALNSTTESEVVSVTTAQITQVGQQADAASDLSQAQELHIHSLNLEMWRAGLILEMARMRALFTRQKVDQITNKQVAGLCGLLANFDEPPK